MKRILGTILVLVTLIAMAGCGTTYRNDRAAAPNMHGRDGIHGQDGNYDNANTGRHNNYARRGARGDGYNAGTNAGRGTTPRGRVGTHYGGAAPYDGAAVVPGNPVSAPTPGAEQKREKPNAPQTQAPTPANPAPANPNTKTKPAQ